jgi:hypothetical protein
VLPSRSQALALAFLATTFIVGGAAGWGLRGWAVYRRQLRSRDPQTMVAYLTKQLGLSAAQQDSVRTVLENHRVEMDSIWLATRPRVDSLRRIMQVEIDEHLTPSQRSRFRELMARHERHRHAVDSVSREQLWDSDHDRVPTWIDYCRDTPPGAAVDSIGCTARSDRNGVK